jgi:ADP-heptose:LPS heptosyltransferase/polysaccharide pyruvyl transferase WcaK-like protein
VHIGVNFFGAGNIGDDLMLAGFLSALGERIDHIELTCCTAHDIESQIRRFPQIGWLADCPESRMRALDSATAWLALGGTPFQLRSGPWMKEHLFDQLEMVKRKKIPVFFLGVGVEEPTTLVDPILRQIARSADVTWTRDHDSAVALRPFTLGSVREGSDLSHAYLSQLELRRPTNGLALLLASEEPGFERKVESALQSLEQRNIAWLVQDVRKFPGSELDVFAALPHALQQKLSVVIPNYSTATMQELATSWPSSRVVASSRYHCLCLTAWSGARAVAVERSGKISAIARDLGIPIIAVSNLAEGLLQAESVQPNILHALTKKANAMVDDFCRAIGINFAPDYATRKDAKAKWAAPPANIRQIAVIKKDSIGDFVLATAFLRELRTIFPRAEITLYVRAAVGAIAKACRFVDRVVLDGHSSPSVASLAVPVGGYDLVVIPRAARDYFGGLRLAALVGGKEIVGFGCTAMNASDRLILTHDIRLPPSSSHARMNLELLRLYTDGELDDRLELEVSEKRARLWCEKLSLHPKSRPLCLIGFMAQNPAYVWHYEKFVTVMRHIIQEFSLVPVLVADESARGVAEKICAQFNDEVLNLTGYPLDDVCAVATYSALYVGNDTGPKHIAAAVGVPVVEINPYLFGLGGAEFFDAGPVHFHSHRVPNIVLQPPLGMSEQDVRSGVAINHVDPQDVIRAISDLIGSPSSGALRSDQSVDIAAIRRAVCNINAEKNREFDEIVAKTPDVAAHDAPVGGYIDDLHRALWKQHLYLELLEDEVREAQSKVSNGI